MSSDNKKEAARKKSLGELGELFALKSLVDQKFDTIRNLNDQKMNEKFADIVAEKAGKRYVISVKARNKYQINGKLNTRYNLGSNAYENARYAEEKYDAKAYWLAVQFDSTSFSIYFGSLDSLNGSKAIPVNKCENGIIGETWELNKRHYFDFDYYSNK
jgi:Holliday junction resolvase